MKGQTTLIAILLIVVIFISIFMFLFSSLDVLRADSYIKLHSNNLLISLLRTDTGLKGDPNKCGKISDILHCSVASPSWLCGSNRCGDLAETGGLIDLYMSKTIDPKLDYYLTFAGNSLGNPDIENKTRKQKVQQRISKLQTDIDVVLYVGEA